MSKMLLVILIALSPALLNSTARADEVVAQCAGPIEGGRQNGSIDAKIANEIEHDWAYLKGFKEGYTDRDSAGNSQTIGGKGKVCDGTGERAYVCDLEGAVYCYTGSSELCDRVDVYTKGVGHGKCEQEKGRDNDQDVLRGCRYAGSDDFNKEPLKNEVAPAKWGDDASKCGFAEGYFHLPCKYVYVVHGVKSEHQIKELQEKVQDKERAHLFRNSCRSDAGIATRDRKGKKIHSTIGNNEDVRSIIGDYENEGEKWRTHNQTPDTWGNQAPPPAPVVVTPVAPPPPPPPPVDPCSQVNWDSYHDCPPLWANCRGHVPPPKMQACKCDLENCTKVLDFVASRFPDLSQSTGSAAFFAKNQIKERAQRALNGIEGFRKALLSEKLPGTYYQNGDIDHCIFAKFAALADSRNITGDCNAKPNSPSLATLESDLKRITSNQDIEGIELDHMKDEFSPLANMATYYTDSPGAKISTQKVLGGQASPALYDATQKMLLSFYSLSVDDGKVPFSDLATQQFNYKYFRNRTEKRIDNSSGQGFKDEVSSYYFGTNPGDACIQAPTTSDSNTLRNFESQMRNDLHWDQVYAQLDIYCSGDPNHYPVAGTAKSNAVRESQKPVVVPMNSYHPNNNTSQPASSKAPPTDVNVDSSTLR